MTRELRAMGALALELLPAAALSEARGAAGAHANATQKARLKVVERKIIFSIFPPPYQSSWWCPDLLDSASVLRSPACTAYSRWVLCTQCNFFIKNRSEGSGG